MRSRSALIALALLAAGAATASAQAPVKSNLSGLSVGVAASGAAMKFDLQEAKNETGGGIGVRIGYGFTQNIETYIEAHGARMTAADDNGTYALAHVDLGARYNLLTASSAIRPYVGVSLNSRQMQAEVEELGATAASRGIGFSVGGGTHYFLTPRFSIEAGVQYTGGSFSESRVGDKAWEELSKSVGARSTRLNFGLSWHL